MVFVCRSFSAGVLLIALHKNRGFLCVQRNRRFLCKAINNTPAEKDLQTNPKISVNGERIKSITYSLIPCVMSMGCPYRACNVYGEYVLVATSSLLLETVSASLGPCLCRWEVSGETGTNLRISDTVYTTYSSSTVYYLQ